MTSELIGLAPRNNKALAVSACTTLIYLGESLAGLLIAWVLRSTLLTNSPFSDVSISRYDAVLVGLSLAIAVQLMLTPLLISRRVSSTI